MRGSVLYAPRPLITVITLSYNSVHLIDSIDSVLMQTYENIQYIIVDDGSSNFEEDAIRAHLDKYKSQGIMCEIVANPRNMGTVKAFNIALRKARGEYIFSLAADDVFFDSTVISEWVQEFQQTNADLIVGRMAVYDPTLTSFCEFKPYPYEVQLLEEGNSKKIFRAMTNANFIIGCSTARTRASLEKYGYFDEDYFLLEDYPYALRAIRNHAKVSYWDRTVIRYRQGGTSSPQKFNTVYEKDSDLNFNREILPYTSHPTMARLKYWIWKFECKEQGAFILYYQEFKKKQQWYKLPFMIIRFPIPVLKAIKRRFKDNIVRRRLCR